MLELKTLSGEIIDLNKSEVTIEMNNSLFNDGSKFSGSLSYPIDVAFSKKNKMLLGYAHAVETGVKATNVQVYAKIGGKSFRLCNLVVGVGDNAFDCSLQIDLGTLNTYISATKLTQVNFADFTLGRTVAQIQAAMLTAAANLDWRTIPYTFFPVRNPSFTGEATAIPADPPTYSGDPDNPIAVTPAYAEKATLINSMVVENGSVKFNVQANADTAARYHTTPFFYLAYILDAIALQLGFVLKGDFILHPDVATIVVYDVNGTFITRDADVGYLPEEKQGIFFSASEHLPDITISEFFKILCAYFCIRITPDIASGELNISWKKSTLEKPVFKDWSEKLIRIRKQEFAASDGYTISAEVDKLDSDKDPVTDVVTVGAGKEDIPIKAGALRMLEEPMLDTKDIWKIPFDNRAGNIVDPIFKELENYKPFEGFNSFPVRFMFSKGLARYGTNPIPYPLGSSEGSEISLNMNSLFNYAINPWFSRTYACKAATASFHLTPADICTLKDSDIIMFKGENGTTVQAIFQKLTFTSKGEYHIAAEADLIILDSGYIKDPEGTGVFVKTTQVNEKTVESSVPNLNYKKTTTFDLVINLYADRNCSIPLEDPDVFVYMKQARTESRANNFIDDRLPTANKSVRVENDSYETYDYRKIRCRSNQLTVPALVKYYYRYYLIVTDDAARSNVITAIRNATFTIEPSADYTIIK